jgi:hypothetical protein
LLHHLTRSFDLAAAVDVFKTASERLLASTQLPAEHKSFTHELLHQSRSRLLHHHVHTGHHGYKPAQIRSFLQESIILFPHNTIFLSLFAWNESRFRIDDRVRDVLRHVIDPKPTRVPSVPVTSHLFAVSTELHRPVYSGSTQHSVRAVFERALSGDAENDNAANRSSLSLWKLYILFELSRGNAARAKELFYRAMRACPWSKDILLLPVQHPHLREGFDFWELRKIYNVLTDKELRVHVEIGEEVFDEAERIVIRAVQQRREERPLPIHLPEDRDSDGSEGGE